MLTHLQFCIHAAGLVPPCCNPLSIIGGILNLSLLCNGTKSWDLALLENACFMEKVDDCINNDYLYPGWLKLVKEGEVRHA